jgi:ABC-type Mn2+/Zn2+ transport system ATPase subunit
MRREMSDVVLGYGRRRVVRAGGIVAASGRCLGIYGPNGSGKTTLLRGLLGLLEPLEGRIATVGDLRPAFLPQHRELELHWPMSGFDAAALFASARGRFGRIHPDDGRTLGEMIRLLEVEPLASRPFARLSGGEQQRLLLAGLLATVPNLLVLDEPTEGLDARSIDMLVAQLRAVREAGEAAVVIVSHDIDDLLALCDEVALIHPARSAGEPAEAEILSREEFPRRVFHLGTGAPS